MDDSEVIYFDYAATTPVHQEVLKAMLPYFSKTFGNPSSIHIKGHEAKIAIEEARAKIASFIGVLPSEIYFTSGGTEANMTYDEFNGHQSYKLIH